MASFLPVQSNRNRGTRSSLARTELDTVLRLLDQAATRLASGGMLLIGWRESGRRRDHHGHDGLRAVCPPGDALPDHRPVGKDRILEVSLAP